ncbi:hypothetical protein COBT_002399 [Conglomerata obtusa]
MYITQKEASDIDNKLIEYGYTLSSLVEIAGLAAFDVISSIIQEKNQSFLVLIGPGNNGGDGLVIARYLAMTGNRVSLYIHKTKHEDLLNICKNLGIPVYNEMPNHNFDCVIDAILGYSQTGKIKEPYCSIITEIALHKKVIAIDVPSGCEVDGICEFIYVPWAVVCFVAPKKCCSGVVCYVTRSFVPKNIFFDETLTNYYTFVKVLPKKSIL